MKAEEWIEIWKKDIKHTAEKYMRGRYNKEKLEKWNKEELLEVIYDLIDQYCYEGSNCDTGALSCNAEGIAVLSDVGLFEIEDAWGRMAKGKIKEVW